MMWLIFITVHVISLVTYTLLLRKSALGSINNTFLSALMTTGIFLPTLWFLVNGSVSFDLTTMQWTGLVAGGFMLAVLMLSNTWAMSRLDASEFSIIYNVRLLATTMLGWLFLGELPATLQIVGGVIIFLSILVLNLHRDQRWRSTPILIGLFAMLWFSFHATLEKFNLLQVGIETYLFWFTLIGVMLMWLLVILQKVDIKTELRHVRGKSIYALLVTRALSAFAYVYALQYGTLAVTNYVSGMAVVIIVIAGVFVLGERDNMRAKFLATAIAVVGLTLILVSKLFHI